MLFYQLDVEVREWDVLSEWDEEEGQLRESARARLADSILEYREEEEPRGRCALLLTEVGRSRVSAAAWTMDERLTEEQYAPFFQMLGLDYGPIKMKEITGRSYVRLVGLAAGNDLIPDADDWNMRPDALFFYDNCKLPLRERMVEKPSSKAELIRRARAALCPEELVEEIERIYAKPAADHRNGHPVHYIIQTDSDAIAETTVTLLLSALNANGRLTSRRYGSCTLEQWEDHRMDFCTMCAGGSLVISQDHAPQEGEYATSADHALWKLGNSISRFGHGALLVIVRLPRASDGMKERLYEQLGDVVMVELTEERVSGERARCFLREQAKKKGLKGDRELYREVRDDRSFYQTELMEIVHAWYARRIRTVVYPQYAHLHSAKKEVAHRKPKGDAYSQLQEMVGLGPVKEVIDQALDFAKAKKLFREQGMSQQGTAMHMVFTGSPGTAKTSVARLLAQIMGDNKLLSKGRLYEVGRADLVGRYVGWTAKNVKEAFSRAKGSVLFIDEAYSLVDDRSGSYGDEAINTIVQEMENCREDMVVIFAGYPDKMEEFLERNPGLQSRIAFHVPFDDYTPEELCRITRLLAEKQQLTLADGVEDKLLPIFAAAARREEFGNGRFARNLLEQARMRQASRLVAMDVDRVTRQEIATLLPEDFQAPRLRPERDVRKVIGFAV